MTIFFIIIFFLLLVPYCDAAQLSFSFTSFNPNIHGKEYDGDASVSNKVIQPTLNQNDKTMTSSSGQVLQTNAALGQSLRRSTCRLQYPFLLCH
ncbi:hypothetical protein ACSBR1_022442 [Camellia fascicularis]